MIANWLIEGSKIKIRKFRKTVITAIATVYRIIITNSHTPGWFTYTVSCYYEALMFMM